MTQLLDPSLAIAMEEVQHFVLENASWELYEQLLKAVGNRPIRITFDEGRLELMSPLPEHEQPKKRIARMIEMLAFERAMRVACYGSTTFRSRRKSKGLEPDECYYFRDEQKMRKRKRISLNTDPTPELVVEIDITSRSLPREPIYAALEVPELWRWDGRALQCLHLVKGQYRVRKNSLVFPFLEPARLIEFMKIADDQGDDASLRAFVQWIRKNGWSN